MRRFRGVADTTYDRRVARRKKTAPGVDEVFHVELPVDDLARDAKHQLELADHPAGAQRPRHLSVRGDRLRRERWIEPHAVLHERAEVKAELVASALAFDPIQHM